jgi:hypothetical protein
MRRPPPIPQALIRTTFELHGPAGAGWLERLPTLIAESQERWSLEVGLPFPELSFHYVAPALRADGKAAVLKLTFPEDPGFRSEAEALRLFNGQGATQLLESSTWTAARCCWSASSPAYPSRPCGTKKQPPSPRAC